MEELISNLLRAQVVTRPSYYRPKAVLGKALRYYWTGILGGMIWGIWFSSLLVLRTIQLPFRGGGVLVWLFGWMPYVPMNLSDSFSNRLIIWAHDRANGGTIFLVPYYRAGDIMSFFTFVVVGIPIGILVNVSDQDARRRRLIVLLASTLVLWFCWTFYLLFAYAMWSD